MDEIFSALIPDATAYTRETIAKTLSRFGGGMLRLAVKMGTRIRPLDRSERYLGVSKALSRMGIDVDRWVAPPAGLFVVEERTVYLRSMSPMTTAHEFGHAIDCALGDGVYRSSVDPDIRSAFSTTVKFVTPYAATGLDEYFAESVRAYVGMNDPASNWPRATRERLRRVDPTMYGIVQTIFAKHALEPDERQPGQLGVVIDTAFSAAFGYEWDRTTRPRRGQERKEEESWRGMD